MSIAVRRSWVSLETIRHPELGYVINALMADRSTSGLPVRWCVGDRGVDLRIREEIDTVIAAMTDTMFEQIGLRQLNLF